MSRQSHRATDNSPAVTDARCLQLLRLTLGFVFFWFGWLKFYPDLSPAEMLATQTIMRLPFQSMAPRTVMLVLAAAECLIGLALIFQVCLRPVIWMLLLHLVGTFLPLFLLPELMFKFAPFAPTIEGEFILKNLVFVAAALIVQRSVSSVPAVSGAARLDGYSEFR